METTAAQKRVNITTTQEDTEYLRRLAKDTWRCMDQFVSARTGFPFDTDQKPDGTNTTNIGLYLASLSVASEMGLIGKEDARKKAELAVDSLLKLQHWKGFFVNTVNVFGDVRASAGGNAISDFNKLPAGLIMVRQVFPELGPKCSKLLDRMDWSAFYDSSAKAFYGGFDVVEGEALKWPIDLLATDTRLAVFFAVATGAAPAELWYKLKRDHETHYGMQVMKPSWYGGGIFMQGICGLFLDERETELGRSMADFAYAQMLFARDAGSPVWGWSSSYSPWGDYLGWGGLRGNVITPHASALAVIYYPKKVSRNLRALEEYGLRKGFMISDRELDLGFRDAVDIDTGNLYEGYVCALDQGMLFLSLANYLDDGIVWRTFEKDPIVIKGRQLLSDYFSPRPEFSALYKKRDSDELPEAKIPRAPKKEYPEQIAIDYDLARAQQHVTSRDLGGLDMSAYNAVSFMVKGDKEARFTHSFRIELESANSGAAFKFKGVTDKWRKVTVPLREFGGKHTGWNGADSFWGGFITDRDKIKKINFVFDLADCTEGKGKVFLSDICFETAGAADIARFATSLNDFPDSPVWANGVIDDFGTAAGWSTNIARGASVSIKSVPKDNGNCLKLDYDLGGGKTGRWVVIEKERYLTLGPENYSFKFLIKVEGNENNLEFKLIDINNSTFGMKIALAPTAGEWKEISVKTAELAYWWGGDTKLDRIKKISFALSTKTGGKGTVFLDELRLIPTSRLVTK
ncbi:MAG: hypothetical protein KBB79_04450 [Candidatus Omnitrophica bacterium]|nr:hypothetical protein [Candidatus Omnitrophota bacterium]